MNLFFQKLHELNNANRLADFLPRTTAFDMYHNFSRQNVRGHTKAVSTFDSMLHAASLDDYGKKRYEYMNSQNQVLLHAIAFTKLYKLYKKYLQSEFFTSADSDKRLPMIDSEQYKALPKRYRGVFVPAGEKFYRLNVSGDAPMIIGLKKSDQDQANELLARAKELILSLYERSHEEKSKYSKDFSVNPFSTNYSVTFISDSFKTQFVTDEQTKAITELHDIFVNLSEFTLPYSVKWRDKKESGAWTIYNEYMDEIAQKNVLVEAQDCAEKLKYKKDQIIHYMQSAFNSRTKYLTAKHYENRAEILHELALQINMHVK